MHAFRVVPMLAALVTGLASGCARGSAVEAAPEVNTSSAAELESIYRARLDSARMRFTAADVRFMTAMIVHHSQALMMARHAVTNGASAPIQTLAARIVNAQHDEIATMQRWLRDRGQAVPAIHDDGTTLMVHGAEHRSPMQGMLTPEQLRGLEAARGAEFDRLFLTLMIRHHRGAVAMVHELFATDGAGQDEEVFKFASDAQVDQSTEIARMELMLQDLSSATP